MSIRSAQTCRFFLLTLLAFGAIATAPAIAFQNPTASDNSSTSTPENRPLAEPVLLRPLEAASPEKQQGPDESKPESTPRNPVAGWDEGFFLSSADKNYQLRITGQIQADFRSFLNSHDAVDIDSFFLRRARLGIEATMFRYYEFRLLPDYGQGQDRIQDAYLNIHYWDEFQIEAGKFKQPVSYEQLLQDRFVPTVERSILDQIVPARDVGLMAHGQKLFEGRLDYALAVANGSINGNSDTNDGKDLSGRLAVRPFIAPDLWPVLHGLQVGVSGSYGHEGEPVNPNTLRTPATVPWFTYAATVRAAGERTRFSPEVAYFFRSFGFAAQYLRQEQELQPNAKTPNSVRVGTEGFYVLASYLLTGEERTTYSQAITPLRPFDLAHPCISSGAWELVGRVSRLHLDGPIFGPVRLADPALSSQEATELTLGFNYYLNKWVRVQFNWEHASFDSPIRLGPSNDNRIKEQDTLLTRFQIIF